MHEVEKAWWERSVKYVRIENASFKIDACEGIYSTVSNFKYSFESNILGKTTNFRPSFFA
jgi:hypothetical protein